MEEQLVKVLCKLIGFMGKINYSFSNSEEFVNAFLREAKLCLSPNGKETLINAVKELNKFNEMDNLDEVIQLDLIEYFYK